MIGRAKAPLNPSRSRAARVMKTTGDELGFSRHKNGIQVVFTANQKNFDFPRPQRERGTWAPVRNRFLMANRQSRFSQSNSPIRNRTWQNTS